MSAHSQVKTLTMKVVDFLTLVFLCSVFTPCLFYMFVHFFVSLRWKEVKIVAKSFVFPKGFHWF